MQPRIRRVCGWHTFECVGARTPSHTAAACAGVLIYRCKTLTWGIDNRVQSRSRWGAHRVGAAESRDDDDVLTSASGRCTDVLAACDGGVRQGVKKMELQLKHRMG
ncbi:unnamed protein product, partial [Ectocarpus sp. 12 AP-2014]